jgi:putative tryptophan/tyrosine transport system substrate-binding protein
MSGQIRRREFITLLGGAAVAWPLAARAQQTKKIARIGVLWHAGSAEEEAVFLRPLVEGIAKLGYVEGQNVAFEHRFPAEQPERFKALAAELAQLDLDVLVTSAPAASYAAKAATTKTPIVFIVVPDPVEGGLVDSLARPGGNITGYAVVDVSPKRLQLFKETFPALSRVALLINPDNRATAQRSLDQVQAAGGPLGLTVQPVEVRGPQGFERAFSQIPRDGRTGVITVFDAMFFNERRQMAEVAVEHGLPVMAPADVYVKSGLLMSYGPNLVDLFRRAGVYVDKILKGAKPSDLPIEQPIRYDLAINLKTAKVLGLEVPPSLLVRADEVIE